MNHLSIKKSLVKKHTISIRFFFHLRDIPHSLCLQWLAASRARRYYSREHETGSQEGILISGDISFTFHTMALLHFEDLLQVAVNRQMNERYGSDFFEPMLRYPYSFESDISLVSVYICGPSVLESFEWPCRNSAADPNRWFKVGRPFKWLRATLLLFAHDDRLNASATHCALIGHFLHILHHTGFHDLADKQRHASARIMTDRCIIWMHFVAVASWQSHGMRLVRL